MMQIRNERNNSTAFLLTLVFPFGGLIYSLSNWREKWAKNAFWLACIYLGAVFIYWHQGTNLGEGGDGGRYVLDLMSMYGSNITLAEIFGRYQVDSNTMDLYQPLLTYFISRFTDNGHVLFAAFAIVFGFFYSRNLWYIIERLPERKMGGLYILVALYFLICPITQINGVRMWTALHVFVYGMMPYLLERDKSKVFWVLVTPLIHFSFLYVVLLAIVYCIIPYRFKAGNRILMIVALVLFIVTLFVNTLNLDTINGMLEEYSPESYEGRINQYVSQDVANRNKETRSLDNWYVAASGNIKNWCLNLLLVFLLPCFRRNHIDKNGLTNLYMFALLLGSFANIMALIPSGGRFQLLSQMFKVPLILLVAMSVSKTDIFRKYVNVALVFLLIPFVVAFRKLFDYFSITAIFGNFITVFFWENNVALITFIKRLL